MVDTNPRGPARTLTAATCADCGKQTTVPFVPTPGRPVFCRDCFAKQNASAPPRQGPPQRAGPPPQRGPGGFSDRPRQERDRNSGPNARKRMMAQGRKTHFMYDAREILSRPEGGIDDQHHRAFLEGLFARGARTSTEAAREFLDEKLADGTLKPQEHAALSQLIERYSFWR